MQRVQGWVENGNITVSIANTGFVSSTKVQGSFPSGTVTVYLAGTLTLASIYSDDLAVPTVKANPFTAASSGQWFFYAANAVYDVKFSGGGIAAPFTLGSIGAGVSDAGVPSYAFSSLPTSKTQNQGNLARVSDRGGGLWMDSGSAWQAIDSLSGLLANVYDYGAIGNGGADDRAAFNSAIVAMTALGNGGTVLVPEGNFKIGSNLTATTAVQFIFLKGAILKPSAGVTVTLSGDLSAGLYQIFDPANGTIVLGRSSCREVIPQWWGALGDDSHDDYAACQAWLNAAFGPAANPNSPENNIPAYLPPGIYRLSAALAVKQVRGGRIFGNSRQSSVLKTMSNAPCLRTDGFSYSIIERLTFRNAITNTNQLLDLDAQSGTLGLIQSVTIRDCFFDGGAAPCADGVDVAISGLQSDTILIENCFFFKFYDTGYYQGSFNALQNTLIGCDFQGCALRGIYAIGQVNVISCGFQNAFGWNSSGTALTGTAAQIDNNGADIHLQVAAGDICMIRGCRTESWKFLQLGGAGQLAVVENNYQTCGGGVTRWASGHAYSLGALVTGSITAGDGQLYKCTTAGTSGGGEPVWPGSGLAVADNTVVWAQVEFDVIGPRANWPVYINFNLFSLGKINICGGSGQNFVSVISNNCFSRTDWMGSQMLNFQSPTAIAPLLFNNVVPKGMLNAPVGAQGGDPESYDHGGNPGIGVTSHNAFDYGMAPLFFSGATSAGSYGNPVGVRRGDPAYTNAGGVLALLGIVGRLVSSLANTAGTDMAITGGQGTGTGISGKLNLQTAPAGAAGSTPNTPVTALQLDDSATANATRALIYDITAAALRRVTIGAADSGGAGFRVLRIPN